MSNSLEARVPFCTKKVLEIALGSKLEWNFSLGKPKSAIYKYSKNFLPDHIFNRNKKVGRPIPFNEWLKFDNSKTNFFVTNREIIEHLYSKDFYSNIGNFYKPFNRTLWGVYCLIKWINVNKVSV